MSDYIDREKLKQTFSEDAINTLSCYDSSLMDLICLEIDEIESENVKPVVYGKWVECFEDWRQQIVGDKCSACGFEHYGTNISHYHFCPNCGADMRGKQSVKSEKLSKLKEK